MRKACCFTCLQLASQSTTTPPVTSTTPPVTTTTTVATTTDPGKVKNNKYDIIFLNNILCPEQHGPSWLTKSSNMLPYFFSLDTNLTDVSSLLFNSALVINVFLTNGLVSSRHKPWSKPLMTKVMHDASLCC